MRKIRQTVGLYQDGKALKVAALSGKGEVIIERLDQPREFLVEEWPGLLVSGILSEKVLIRHVRSPLKKGQALLKTLPFQLETLIPFSLDEVVAHPQYHRVGDETVVSFFVVAEKSLNEHIREQVADPDWVSTNPVALYRFAKLVGGSEGNFLVFHMGNKTTEIISASQDGIEHQLSVGIGLSHLREAYKKDNPKEKNARSLNLRRLTKKEFPHLTDVLKEFERDVDRAFCYLAHKQKTDQQCSFIFAGETETFVQIESFVEGLKSFSFTTQPILDRAGYESKTLKSYAIPIGLAIDALKQDKVSIQFRLGKYIAPKIYQTLKKKALKSVALSFTCILCLSAIGHFYYQKKEERFQKKIDGFLSQHATEIPELEKISRGASSGEKIALLDRKVKRNKRDFGYFSSPPQVADVLAFLSTHPKLCRSDGEKKMETSHLHTQLIKFPSVQNPYESYKMKVKLVFTSPQSDWAREFHDAIIEESDWVDSEEEVTWDRKQDVYTITFFFKSR